MTKEINLKLEILVNSHGPHEQVRIKEPFCGLQRLGLDCRIFRYPFRLNRIIRQNSLVIWQRPRPTSWEQQLYIIRWMRNNGSLLLTEWDDHPNLFPKEIRDALNEISMAPLKLCHALHTSSQVLANALTEIQPKSYILENAIWRVPNINTNKHIYPKEGFRIFIGNQNRTKEHQQLSEQLKEWCYKDSKIKIIIIGDAKLADTIPKNNLERYPLLQYLHYRKIMRSCHIALLPLENNLQNNCKTEIKWMEAAAESVVTIGGPGLYKNVFNHNMNGIYCTNISEFIPQAQYLINNLSKRLEIVSSAYKTVKENFNLRDLLPSRIETYKNIWENRFELDKILLERFPEIDTEQYFNR